MMPGTDIAQRSNGWGVALDVHQPDQQRTPVHGGVTLVEWVDQARQVAGIAEMLAVTSFVPKAFRGKPAETAAAILAGQEVGMSPMAALRAIDVIEGKPGMSALALRALVQSHGHDIWVHESTTTRAIVKGRRRGSERVETSTWTIERAATMGLVGKDNWRKQPTAMLLARATAECARLVAADVLLGMPYSTEELADGWDAPEVAAATAAEPVRQARRTARRAAAPQPAAAPTAAPEPDFDDEPAMATPAVEDQAPGDDRPARPTGAGKPEGRPILGKQRDHIHAICGELGFDRDDKLAYASQILGRDIATTNDLTMREAAQFVAALERYRDQSEPPSEVAQPAGGA